MDASVAQLAVRRGPSGSDLGHSAEPDLGVLEQIAGRVLWLAVRMIDGANRDGDAGDGIPVGGHQASCASLVPAMTALYFAHLDRNDKVSVKPHASPVFHAIQYLLGELDRSYLTRLRARGGLQAYPNRARDPDGVDFSTGSLGLGSVAPLFAAVTRRYVDDHFGAREPSRFISLLGDAELDEGTVWEAIAEPAAAGLGNVLWIVDCNRQSVDRVVPVGRARQREAMFAAAGWHVCDLRYGRRLRAQFARPHGAALRRWWDELTNADYRAMFHLAGAELRRWIRQRVPAVLAGEIELALADVPDAELGPLLQDFGGQDLGALLEAYAECDTVTDRPSVIFAHTVKGWGLPTAWDPRNHYALLTRAQIDVLRSRLGVSEDAEWDCFHEESDTGRWCRERAARLARPGAASPPAVRSPGRVPEQVLRPAAPEANGRRNAMSTQEGFGQIVTALAGRPQVAPLLVTTAPDVATGTGLQGFIRRAGSYHSSGNHDWNEADAALGWRQTRRGQHLELGISEMNLFLLLGQLGLSRDLSDQPLLPIGTVYDPFLSRGLDAFAYATYSGARFVVAGTPSGITLAPEGGAHQSTLTPSIGLELPGVTYCEPAYVGALDWLLCDALGRIARGEDEAATYLRLSNRSVNQAPFDAARVRLGEERLRRLVLAGAYPLVEPGFVDGPDVYLVGCGAVLPDVVAAAARLADRGVAAHVVDVTSPSRRYATWRDGPRHDVQAGIAPGRCLLFDEVFPIRAPVVTAHDASSHALAWLGSALGVPAVSLGVDTFGQSGSVRDLYEHYHLDADSIANAAEAVLACGARSAVEPWSGGRTSDDK